jgi:hypothetical protein
MLKEAESMLLIEGISPDVESELRDAIADLRQAGIDCSFRYRAPQPQAFLDWLIPTAAVIWFLDKYFGTMLGEAAKDHYKLFKAGLQKIYDKTLGPAKSVTRVVMQDGAVRPERFFSGNVSYMYRAQEGWRVKLLFPLDITFEQYERSCSEFSSLLRQYHQKPADSPLNNEIDYQAELKCELLPQDCPVSTMRPTVSLLVFWEETSQAFRVADPVASGRTVSLVSWPLGGRV